jgi:pyridoxamine 5'-phosphate oxidase
MGLKECAQFATEHPVCFLGTIDGDQPRVRTLLMDHADETGFYFIVLAGKQMTKQIRANPKVEVCWYNNPAELTDCKQLRVYGTAEFLTDQDSKGWAVRNRAFLDDVTGRSVSQLAMPIRIAHGDAHFWVLTDTAAEAEVEHLRF